MTTCEDSGFGGSPCPWCDHRWCLDTPPGGSEVGDKLLAPPAPYFSAPAHLLTLSPHPASCWLPRLDFVQSLTKHLPGIGQSAPRRDARLLTRGGTDHEELDAHCRAGRTWAVDPKGSLCHFQSLASGEMRSWPSLLAFPPAQWEVGPPREQRMSSQRPRAATGWVGAHHVLWAHCRIGPKWAKRI